MVPLSRPYAKKDREHSNRWFKSAISVISVTERGSSRRSNNPACGKGGKVYRPFPRFPQLPQKDPALLLSAGTHRHAQAAKQLLHTVSGVL